LLGRSRLRLVPPPILALAPILRDLIQRRLIEPGMLGTRPDLEPRSCLTDHEAWWQGLDSQTVARLGLALARVLGTWRWLNGPLLQQAWLTALVGWSSIQADEEPLRSDDLDLALFTALCGQLIQLSVSHANDRGVADTWRALLERAGVLIL